MQNNSKTIYLKENNTELYVTYTLKERKENNVLLYGYKISCDDKILNNHTQAIFDDFTDDETIANDTFNILIDNNVLPNHLINILDEMY